MAILKSSFPHCRNIRRLQIPLLGGCVGSHYVVLRANSWLALCLGTPLERIDAVPGINSGSNEYIASALIYTISQAPWYVS